MMVSCDAINPAPRRDGVFNRRLAGGPLVACGNLE